MIGAECPISSARRSKSTMTRPRARSDALSKSSSFWGSLRAARSVFVGHAFGVVLLKPPLCGFLHAQPSVAEQLKGTTGLSDDKGC